MSTRRKDWLRLALLVPLFAAATFGHHALKVDVENLAMKSTGTDIAKVAELRRSEFGENPTVILLAAPRVQELLNSSDERQMAGWVEALKARPEVLRIEEAPSPAPGNRCLAVELRTESDGRYAGTVEAFTAFARDTLPATCRLAISGFPVIEVAIAESLDQEQKEIIPVLFLALTLVLCLIYRSPAMVIGALVAPVLGLYLLEGIEGLLGLAINPISSLLGPTVLTVGVASSVHVLERYRRVLQDHDHSVEQASLAAAHQLRVPFILALCTTVAGFLGLLTNPIPAVREFGLLAPLGVLLATALALLILPSWLRIFHRVGTKIQVEPDVRSAAMHARIVQRLAIPLTAFAGISIVLALGGLRNSTVNNDLLGVLSDQHRASLDAAIIAKKMGGSQTVELLLSPDTEGVNFFRLAGLMTEISQLDGIAGPGATPRLSENGFGLLSFLMAPGGSASRGDLFDSMLRVASENGWSDAKLTGLAAHIVRDSNALVHGQREGLLATVFGLWLVMAIGFRSWKIALLGLVPNVLPVILINGTLAQFGHPMSVASSMIGTVMLGLVVDDTIHWLHAYREARGYTVRRVVRAFKEVRRAIVITSIVLIVGFSATMFGELPPTREFGKLAVATLAIALSADLLLLPGLLLLRRKSAIGRPVACPDPVRVQD